MKLERFTVIWCILFKTTQDSSRKYSVVNDTGQYQFGIHFSCISGTQLNYWMKKEHALNAKEIFVEFWQELPTYSVFLHLHLVVTRYLVGISLALSVCLRASFLACSLSCMNYQQNLAFTLGLFVLHFSAVVLARTSRTTHIWRELLTHLV